MNLKRILVVVLLLVVNAIHSQAQTAAEKYEESLKLWEKLKVEHNNSYEFSMVWGSFSGYSNTTTITVKNGKIVKRAYKEYIPKHQREGRKPKKWVEKGDQIGKHTEGNKAITLDEVYSYAKNLVNTPEEPITGEAEIDGEKVILTLPKIEVYFSTNSQGLISTAGSRPEGCMDDCFSGYSIRDIKWLN